jgi:hypothetical protein
LISTLSLGVFGYAAESSEKAADDAPVKAAINYQHPNGATKIDFRVTPLMQVAHGEAKVESKQGSIGRMTAGSAGPESEEGK